MAAARSCSGRANMRSSPISMRAMKIAASWRASRCRRRSARPVRSARCRTARRSSSSRPRSMSAQYSPKPRSARFRWCCARRGSRRARGCWSARVARQIHPRAPVAILSGPTFAHEVAAGLPTAVTLAATDPDLRRRLSDRLAAPHFRPYASNDVIGAEIGGAVKNVLAIACGVVEGAGLGQNARAALIARGFAEMTRFGLARGARAETLAGLSGLGDLVLTCSSTSSRNFSLGVGLGRGGAAKRPARRPPYRGRRRVHGARARRSRARRRRGDAGDRRCVPVARGGAGGRCDRRPARKAVAGRRIVSAACALPDAIRHGLGVRNRSRCPSTPSRHSAPDPCRADQSRGGACPRESALAWSC